MACSLATKEGKEMEKQLQHLDFGAFELLSLHLRPKNLGRDWRSLADLIGISTEEINWLNEETDPVLSTLKRWILNEGPNATTKKLVACLHEIQRYDTAADLQKYIDAAPTPEEYKKKSSETQLNNEERLKRGPSTINEKYDVFISYAEPDIEFAKLIVRTLEDDKYKIKACISIRDFLPGVHTLVQVVEAIEDRCSKVIAILSEDYVNCEKCDHQSQVALSLSPGCRDRRLIPILYKKCEIPRILKSIFYLDYTDEDMQEYFWTRLQKAIKS